VLFTPLMPVAVAVADVRDSMPRLEVQTMQTRRLERHDSLHHDLCLACDRDASARGQLIIAWAS
jgi:hypothetical protein